MRISFNNIFKEGTRYKALFLSLLLCAIGSFDNHGTRHLFGDNMISANIGLTFNIGKVGFKRPVDAKPYILQNDYLINNFDDICNVNRALHNIHLVDENALKELRKILRKEGLLEKYEYLFREKARDKRNYYKGILALRSRLNAERNQGNVRDVSANINRLHMFEGRDSILNQPVYFFFRLGTAKLTDQSQLLNLDEVARIALYRGITLRVEVLLTVVLELLRVTCP